MRSRGVRVLAVAALASLTFPLMHAQRQRLNPMIELLEQKKPMFGVYWPKRERRVRECGFPATPADIEMRMKQGFSVFVMNWGDAGFKAVEIGRAAAGRQ